MANQIFALDDRELEAEGDPRRLRRDLEIQRQPPAAQAEAEREHGRPERERRQKADPYPVHFISVGSEVGSRA